MLAEGLGSGTPEGPRVAPLSLTQTDSGLEVSLELCQVEEFELESLVLPLVGLQRPPSLAPPPQVWAGSQGRVGGWASGRVQKPVTVPGWVPHR